MINMLIRSLIVFLFVFASIRIMGKRQIGEMQPFELVITLIIADLACIPMAELSVPLSHGLVPILLLLILHFFISFLSRKSMIFRHIFSGRPSIVISPRGINYNALKKLNINLDDLVELMRGCDIFNFDDIAYAIIETNGKMCVLPKKESSPATCKDLKISDPPSALPIAIILDGMLQKENIKLTEVTDQFVFDCMKKAKIAKLKDVLILTLDNNGKVYIQPKKGEYTAFNSNFKGGEKW